MADLFHVTEVAKFTDEELAAMNRAYELAMVGGHGKLTRVDESDGTYSLLNAEGKWVGCGVSTK